MCTKSNAERDALPLHVCVRVSACERLSLKCLVRVLDGSAGGGVARAHRRDENLPFLSDNPMTTFFMHHTDRCDARAGCCRGGERRHAGGSCSAEEKRGSWVRRRIPSQYRDCLNRPRKSDGTNLDDSRNMMNHVRNYSYPCRTMNLGDSRSTTDLTPPLFGP
jgi:hypothetical protein